MKVPMFALLWSATLLITSTRGQQYTQNYDQPQPVRQYATQTPRFDTILMHKQALAQDGTFNYQFKADNGLQQGESIAPDGSRLGAYSYVDPNGKTISVKYSAGKEGFKILEGDHLPKAPAPLPPPAQAAVYTPNQYQQPQPQLYHRQNSAHQKPYQSIVDQGSPFREGLSGYGSESRFQVNQDAINAKSNYDNPKYRVHEEHGDHSRPAANSVTSFGNLFAAGKGPTAYPPAPQKPRYNQPHFKANADHEYDDESDTPVNSGPHTFGNGYSFEFSG